MHPLQEGVHGSPFETSPFVAEKGFQSETDVFWSTNNPRSGKVRTHDEGSPMRAAIFEKDSIGKDNTSGLARIKVVVVVQFISCTKCCLCSVEYSFMEFYQHITWLGWCRCGRVCRFGKGHSTKRNFHERKRILSALMEMVVLLLFMSPKWRYVYLESWTCIRSPCIKDEG